MGIGMRCLVTGGFGYVGSWAARHLAAAGHQVFVLSRSREQRDIGAAYTLVTADLTMDREELVAALPEGVQGCIHAASFNESDSPEYGRRAFAANALGTRNLLEALAEKADCAAFPLPMLVYCSTFHVYGREWGSIDEATEPEPKNEYALTHFLAEEYCRYYGRTRNFPVVIMRLSNGYGAPLTRTFGKWHLLLPDLCRMAHREGKIALRSAPDTKRDFVWLGDVASCMERMLQRPDMAGMVINVASGKAIPIGDIAALVASVYRERYGREITVCFARQTEGRGRELVADTGRLQELLGGIVFHDRLADEVAAIFACLDGNG